MVNLNETLIHTPRKDLMRPVHVRTYDDMGHFMMTPFSSKLYQLVCQDMEFGLQNVGSSSIRVHRCKILEKIKTYHVDNTVYVVHFE
jgi:hypothetical protein